MNTEEVDSRLQRVLTAARQEDAVRRLAEKPRMDLPAVGERVADVLEVAHVCESVQAAHLLLRSNVSPVVQRWRLVRLPEVPQPEVRRKRAVLMPN